MQATEPMNSQVKNTPKRMALAWRRRLVDMRYPFDDAEFGAAGTRIGPLLGVAGDNRLAGDCFENMERIGPWGGPLRTVEKRRGALLEEGLDDAVLERMESDDGQASAPGEAMGELLQSRAQRFEFAIHRDAQRLEDPRGRMRAATPRHDG